MAYDNNPGENIPVLLLERVDMTRRMARYYVLSIQPTLFGDTAMVREWGRIGCSVRRRIELYACPAEAQAAHRLWLHRKLKRGYTVR
jgi:predicted DNA-binding WGR domain protein